MGGRKVLAGITSYKCLSGVFQGAVGGLASGKPVFNFLRSIAGENGLAFKKNDKLPKFDPANMVAHAPELRHKSPHTTVTH